MRLEGCAFSDNNLTTLLPTLLADNRRPDAFSETAGKAVFYSDSSAPSVCTYEGVEKFQRPPPCNSSVTSLLTLEEAGDEFLTASNAWFVQVQQVCVFTQVPVLAVCTCIDSSYMLLCVVSPVML